MKPTIVDVPTIQVPIQKSPGFEKKGLADYKLDLCGLCQFGCRYCSSNVGNYLRINRKRFADLTEEQTGVRSLPAENPKLMFNWREIEQNLEAQLGEKSKQWGAGKTLVVSMLTDGFSPHLVKSGVVERALRAVLEKTSFRIRILTKNSIVGAKRWIEFFDKHRDRFVIGLSIGTLDDRWAKRVEVGTPPPTRRLAALGKLQKAGIPTFAMLCPIFPDVLDSGRLEELIDKHQPGLTEHIWAEPYNDRDNWRIVRNG